MKKFIALTLALLLALSLVACGGNIGKSGGSSAVKKYVEENGQVFLNQMEASFSGSAGMTCTSSIEAVGDGIEVRININELDNIPDEQKEVMQSTYDALSSTFQTSLSMLQKDEPAIKSLTIYVCEKDGDVLAKIVAN